MTNPSKVCGTCRYSVKDGKALSCHRFPTLAKKFSSNDWCGEWAAIEVPTGDPVQTSVTPSNPASQPTKQRRRRAPKATAKE